MSDDYLKADYITKLHAKQEQEVRLGRHLLNQIVIDNHHIETIRHAANAICLRIDPYWNNTIKHDPKLAATLFDICTLAELIANSSGASAPVENPAP